MEKKHYIGGHYGGGIIFWVDLSGEHGLVAATKDQSAGSNWDDAFIICSKYRGEGGDDDYYLPSMKVLSKYQDWYLPLKEELNLLYQQKSVVGGFEDYSYWSSTEYGSDYAWNQDFGNGIRYRYDKFLALKVRAIRAF